MIVIETAGGGIFALALNLTAAMLALALLAAIWRLIVGPTGPDRVVALDMVAMLLVVFLLVFAMATATYAYVYAAIALALIAFLSTVAFAHYIERTMDKSDE
ncbi:monovalent cation/H+ antiporter complex subunit F [Aureimonas populi]|uniref:Monovalent cation/H+ antiporter complex subunit F n=1 Tax=Aureimonas populi TaxID=1701758 RepID=A0ABW5CR64_9HYPH|nr:monovalent cation/H+ antiporter complex subunit F [Aureimonas populi]